MAFMTPAPLNEMDGRRLYYTFIAGARKVIEHQVELNKINVFPVNDGDTGTNLASTIRAVVDSLHPHRSYKITADRIAETTLVNARGRVSAVRGLIARMLNINPIVSIDESGNAIVFGKTFNLRAN